MASVDVNNVHTAHPQLRAQDWRSPLVRRLLGSDAYSDGSAFVSVSYRSEDQTVSLSADEYIWAGLAGDFAQMVKTYQAPVITEFATLAVACATVSIYACLEITEVTRRGDKADYWLGDKELLLEVSGQQSGNLADLCSEKSGQLLDNPFEKSGYVCVANYSSREARLWFYELDGGEVSDE